MKKFVLSVIAVAGIAFASQAQSFGFEKGSLILEGYVGASSSDNKNTETRQTSFTLGPSLGYFVTDKFAVGIKPGFHQSKSTNYSGTNDTFTKSNTYGAAIYGRYYFLELGNRFKTYTELDLGYATSGNETGNGTTTVKSDRTNTIGVNAGLGANFFITKRIAIGYQFTDLINYSSTKVNNSSAKPVSSFDLNLNSFDNFFSTGQFSLTFKLK